MRIGWITRGIALLASVLAASLQAQTIELPHLSTEAARREAAREVAHMLERALAEVEAGRLVVVEAEPPLEFLILDPELERSPMTSDPGAMAAARSALREARAISGERGTDPVVDHSTTSDAGRPAAAEYRGTWQILLFDGQWLRGAMNLDHYPGHEGVLGTIVWEDGTVENALLEVDDPLFAVLTVWQTGIEEAVALEGRVEEPGRRLTGAVTYGGTVMLEWEATRVDGRGHERRNR